MIHHGKLLFTAQMEYTFNHQLHIPRLPPHRLPILGPDPEKPMTRYRCEISDTNMTQTKKSLLLVGPAMTDV